MLETAFYRCPKKSPHFSVENGSMARYRCMSEIITAKVPKELKEEDRKIREKISVEDLVETM